jgi:hypothetical protein
MQAMFYARAGATFYVLWGLLHLYVAYELFKFADGVEPLAASARLDQLAAYIGSAAVASIVIAAKNNWWNEPLGYWLNLAIVSVNEDVSSAADSRRWWRWSGVFTTRCGSCSDVTTQRGSEALRVR